MPIASTQALAIARLLHVLAERHASDLHLVPGNYPTMRLDGKLQPLTEEGVVTTDSVAAAVDFLLTADQQAILQKDRQVIGVYNWEGRARFRVEAQYELDQLSLSLRYIPSQVMDLQTIKAPPLVQQLVGLDRGLVIVAGPVGSGRTAVSAALINEINNNRQVRVVTIEKPVEYLFVAHKALIEQREVGRDVANMATGLVQARNGDADIVFASPVVTTEDWQAALETVESGKALVAVTAGETAASTLEHIHASVPVSQQSWVRNLFSGSLIAIIVLRLVPKIGGGQILAFEVATVNSAVQSALREGRFWQLSGIIQTSRQEGMQSLDFALAKLVKDGLVSREDALAQAPDQRSLLAQLRGI